ncbi:MAG: AAA family ATPase [Acidimicrobiales bacterium]|nr:AAA family ATPase [Acidimicrobiales bacterium]
MSAADLKAMSGPQLAEALKVAERQGDSKRIAAVGAEFKRQRDEREQSAGSTSTSGVILHSSVTDVATYADNGAEDPWNGLLRTDPWLRAALVREFGGDEKGVAALVLGMTPESRAKAFRPHVEAHRNRTTVEQERIQREQAMFKRWTMAELLAEPCEFEWLAAGLFADPTYGQIAGEMKTLKSYVTGFIEVGIAAGLPIFGHFAPPAQRPVVAYVGEGGRRLWTRRMRRICSAMGTTPADIDLHPSFDVAPISSLTFQDSLRRDLDELNPGLVTLDPLYTYHGTDTRAADLHQEGSLLNQLSGPCMDVGASLAVVNHYNQTGSGAGLKRITMAGSGEWADSWVLIAHREQPDVDGGVFRLTFEVGSRQWGGTSWDLDISIGRFDQDTGSHDGEITWDLNRSNGAKSKNDKRSEKEYEMRRRISDTVTDHPFELTKAKIRTIVGGNADMFFRCFDEMAQDGEIRHDRLGSTEAGTTKKRELWGPAFNPSHSNGTGWGDEGSENAF